MVSYTRIRVVKFLPFDIVPKLRAKKLRGKLCTGTTRTERTTSQKAQEG